MKLYTTRKAADFHSQLKSLLLVCEFAEHLAELFDFLAVARPIALALQLERALVVLVGFLRELLELRGLRRGLGASWSRGRGGSQLSCSRLRGGNHFGSGCYLPAENLAQRRVECFLHYHLIAIRNQHAFQLRQGAA